MRLDLYRLLYCWLIMQAMWGLSMMHAQVNVTPPSSNCGCNGSATFFGGPNVNTTYTLLNSNLGVVTTQSVATGTVNFTGLCASVYVIRYTEGGNTENVVFNVPQPGFNPGIAVNSDICSNQINTEFSNLISPLAPGGTWSTSVGAPHSSGFNTNSDAPGLYVYTVGNGGCNVTTGVYVQVIQNSDPGLFTNFLFCEIDPPFNIIDIVEGSPDPGGTWYNSSMQIVSGVFDPATMPTQSFTYVLPGVQGCPQVFNTIVCTNTPLPNPGLDNTILSCADGVTFNLTAQLLGSPEAGGIWYSPSGTIVSSTFNPSVQPAGTYRYQLPAINTCPPQQSLLTINLVPSNPSGASNSVSICPQAGPIDLFTVLGGSPLTGGTWRNPSNQITDNIYDPATEAAGNYSYNYPNVGCSPQNTTVSVQLQSAPSAGADRTIDLCSSTNPYTLSNALSASATAGGSWRTQAGVAVGSTVSIATVGTFVYIYSVGGGSCALDESTITLNVAAPNPPLADQSIGFCTTDNSFDLATLYPNTPGLYFRVQSGAVVSSIFNPGAPLATTYFAVSPTGNECPSSIGTVTIALESPTFTSADPFVGLCSDGALFDLTTISTAIDFTNGSWTDANGFNVSPLLPTDNAGTNVYTFTSPTGVRCAASVLNVTVQVDLPVHAGADSELALCYTAPGFTLSSLLNGASSLNGFWSINGSATPLTFFDPAVSSSTVFTYTLTGSGACISDQSVHSIIVDPGFALEAGVNVEQCSGDGIIELGTPAVANLSYQWSPAVGLNDPTVSNPQLSGEIFSDQSFDQQYVVTATDGLCTETDNVRVTIHPTPELQLPAMTEVCYGTPVSLNTPIGFDVLWGPAGYFSDPATPSQTWVPVQSATVSATISNAFGCSDEATANIVVHPLPQAEISLPDTSGCAPVRYVLTTPGVESTTYTWWSNGNLLGETDSIAFTFFESGVYDITLVATNEFGCIDSATSEGLIEVFPVPTADFLIDPGKITTLNSTVQFLNQSEGASIYDWDFFGYGRSGENSPTYTFLSKEPQTLNICMIASTLEGCRDTVCKSLEMVNEYILYAPNAFTPDMDGVNDIFKPVLLGYEEDTYTLRIFDRWGILVFETNDVSQGWIGDVNGSAYFANNDVYLWQIEVKSKSMADYQTFQGTVTLLR